jgi:alpha-ketoglutarate-dependent taurine dioxygenase
VVFHLNIGRADLGGSAMLETREIRPLGHALGAEVLGMDLSRPLDDEDMAWIERSFASHPVLVFREQNLGAAQLAAFGRRFGRPRPHSLTSYRHEDHPEVSWLRNVTAKGEIDWFGVKRATDWHTDSTYDDHQPRLAILHALEVPSSKGGTMFADMCAAYDALPDATRQKLDGLTGLHGRGDGPAGVRLYSGGELERRIDREYEAKAHPAVRRHPVTGRPILFVNPLHTNGFVGMSKDESWPLIEEVSAHATQDRFVYYHSWRVGDVLMWDELATMHRGAGDYRPDERRIMLRTIVYAS